MSNREEIIDMGKDFGYKPVIVKHYVKSRKHEWYKSCYVEKAEVIDDALQVLIILLKARMKV